MTATDELRRLLDERGVEWMPSAWSAKDETFYKVGDVGYLATELSSGKMKVCIEGYPTPEQTIAATLGGGYQGFWTHDGTLHVELPKLPESISVRLPDKRDREVRSARVWQYTLSDSDATRERQGVVGTCHDKCSRFNAWVCSECGATVLLMFDDYGEPSYSVDGVADVPHYCPNCGRRCVG